MPEARKEPRGPEIVDADAPMHRQIHPNFVQDGRPSSQIFRPTPKDNGFLSLADGRMRSPEEAWAFHRSIGYDSTGTATAAVSAFQRNQVRVHADALRRPEDEYEDPAHAVSDHRLLSSSSLRRVAKSLVEGSSTWFPAVE